MNAEIQEARSAYTSARGERMTNQTLRQTQKVYIGVVHTSPSNEVGIEQETDDLLKQGKWLKEKFGSNIVLAGDWYMERESPQAFDDIARGTDWQMGAAPQRPIDVGHEPTDLKRARSRTGSYSCMTA